LVGSLPHAPALEKLNFSGNWIGDEAMAALRAA